MYVPAQYDPATPAGLWVGMDAFGSAEETVGNVLEAQKIVKEALYNNEGIDGVRKRARLAKKLETQATAAKRRVQLQKWQSGAHSRRTTG